MKFKKISREYSRSIKSPTRKLNLCVIVVVAHKSGFSGWAHLGNEITTVADAKVFSDEETVS